MMLYMFFVLKLSVERDRACTPVRRVHTYVPKLRTNLGKSTKFHMKKLLLMCLAISCVIAKIPLRTSK